jgi:hypothetical protein
MNVSQEGPLVPGLAGSVVLRKYATNYILADIDTESMSKLLGDAHAAEPGIVFLHLVNGCDEFSGRAFRAGLVAIR